MCRFGVSYLRFLYYQSQSSKLRVLSFLLYFFFVLWERLHPIVYWGIFSVISFLVNLLIWVPDPLDNLIWVGGYSSNFEVSSFGILGILKCLQIQREVCFRSLVEFWKIWRFLRGGIFQLSDLQQAFQGFYFISFQCFWVIQIF